MSIPREPNGRPLTLYTLDLTEAIDYAQRALAEGLNVAIQDMDLRDTVTYRSFQESPVLIKYWQVEVATDESAKGYRSQSAHNIVKGVDALTPEQYGAIHSDGLVEFCRNVYRKAPAEAD